MAARIITIASEKGGIGKTTSSVSLASGLQLKGYKTLLIDTDRQCNSSDTYNAIVEDGYTLYDVMFSDTKTVDCITHADLGDIIPSDKIFCSQDIWAKYNEYERFFVLREKLEEIKDLYDYIIIDTSTQLDTMLTNVLVCATDIIIPLTCDRYGVSGLDNIISTICSVKKRMNPELNVMGILICRYKSSTILCNEITKGIEPIAISLNTKVFETKIRETEALKQSQSAITSVYNYDPNSSTAQDYLRLCDEIIKEK